MLTPESWIEAGGTYYAPNPPPEPEPTGPRPSTVWQRLDGASLASHIHTANEEIRHLLAEAGSASKQESLQAALTSDEAAPENGAGAASAAATPAAAATAAATTAADSGVDAAAHEAQSFAGEAIRLVNARFLLALEAEGARLPLREEIPEDVFIDLPALLQMEKSIHGKLRVLWVHGWTARGEGGASEGQMLHRVATALKAHLGLMRNDQAANTFAVYIDKCSLPAQLRDVQYAQARRAQRMNREQAALSDEGANAADVGGIARGNSKSAAEDEEPGEPSEHDAALLACVARLSHRVRRHPHMNKLSV